MTNCIMTTVKEQIKQYTYIIIFIIAKIVFCHFMPKHTNIG